MTSAPRRRLVFKQPEPIVSQPNAAPQAPVVTLPAPSQLSTPLAPSSLLAPPAPSVPSTPSVIRWTHPDDVEVLQGLHLCQLSLAESHHQLYAEEVPEFGADEWYEKLHCGNLCEWMQRGVEILNAKVNGEVVGYISFWPPRRGDGEPSITINHIIVREGHRCMGIGKMLMQSLGHYLEEIGIQGTCRLRLAVASANLLALEWYLLLGFREDGRQKDSAWLLWIKLQGLPIGSSENAPPVRLDMRRRVSAPRVLPAIVQPPILRPRKRRCGRAAVATVQPQKDQLRPVAGPPPAAIEGQLQSLPRKRGADSEGHKDPWRPADDAMSAAAESKLRHLAPQDSW